MRGFHQISSIAILTRLAAHLAPVCVAKNSTRVCNNMPKSVISYLLTVSCHLFHPSPSGSLCHITGLSCLTLRLQLEHHGQSNFFPVIVFFRYCLDSFLSGQSDHCLCERCSEVQFGRDCSANAIAALRLQCKRRCCTEVAVQTPLLH